MWLLATPGSGWCQTPGKSAQKRPSQGAVLVGGVCVISSKTSAVCVLGDSELTLDFCTQKASPSKPELFRGLKRVMALRKRVSGPVVFQHVGQGNNQLAYWLTRVAKALGQSAAVKKLLPNDITLFSGPVCCGKNLWHVCGLFSNACTCTCICGLSLRLHLCLHLRLHWVCAGLHVSAGFHCVCTCVAFVFTPALHLRLHWCCHAASFAMVLHLGCTCVLNALSHPSFGRRL